MDDWGADLGGKLAVECFRELAKRDPDAVRLIRDIEDFARNAEVCVARGGGERGGGRD